MIIQINATVCAAVDHGEGGQLKIAGNIVTAGSTRSLGAISSVDAGTLGKGPVTGRKKKLRVRG